MSPMGERLLAVAVVIRSEVIVIVIVIVIVEVTEKKRWHPSRPGGGSAVLLNSLFELRALRRFLGAGQPKLQSEGAAPKTSQK